MQSRISKQRKWDGRIDDADDDVMVPVLAPPQLISGPKKHSEQGETADQHTKISGDERAQDGS
jgi:hypothetical protein